MSHQTKFTLVLLPYNDAIKSEITLFTKSKAIIELKLKCTKTWDDVFQYLGKKWFGVPDLQNRLEIFAFDLGNSFVIDHISFRIYDKVFSVDNSKCLSSSCENDSGSMLTVYYNLKANSLFNNDAAAYSISDNYESFQPENFQTPFIMPLNQSLSSNEFQINQSCNDPVQNDIYTGGFLSNNFINDDQNDYINDSAYKISNEIQKQDYDNYDYPPNENVYHQSLLPPQLPLLPPDSFSSSQKNYDSLPIPTDRNLLVNTATTSANYPNTYFPTSVTMSDGNDFTYSGLDFELDWSNINNESSKITSHINPSINLIETEILHNNNLNTYNTSNSSNNLPASVSLPDEVKQQQHQQQLFSTISEYTNLSYRNIIENNNNNNWMADMNLDLQFSQLDNIFITNTTSTEGYDNNTRNNIINEVGDSYNRTPLDQTSHNIIYTNKLDDTPPSLPLLSSLSQLPVANDNYLFDEERETIKEEKGDEDGIHATVDNNFNAFINARTSYNCTEHHYIPEVVEIKNINDNTELVYTNILKTESTPETDVEINIQPVSQPFQLQLHLPLSSPSSKYNNSHSKLSEIPLKDNIKTNHQNEQMQLTPPIYASIIDLELPSTITEVEPTTSTTSINNKPQLQQIQSYKKMLLPKPRKYSEFCSIESDSDLINNRIEQDDVRLKRTKRCWEDGITSEDSAGDGESREGVCRYNNDQQHQIQFQQYQGNKVGSSNHKQYLHDISKTKESYSPIALPTNIPPHSPFNINSSNSNSNSTTSASIMAIASSGMEINDKNLANLPSQQQQATTTTTTGLPVLSFPITINKLLQSLKNRRKPWLKRITPTFLGNCL